MKVIVNAISHLGSPTELYVYTSKDSQEGLKKLYEKDLEFYGEDLDEDQTYLAEDSAQVWGNVETSYYEIVEVKEI